MIAALWAVMLDLWNFVRGNQADVILLPEAKTSSVQPTLLSAPTRPIMLKQPPDQLEGRKAIVIADTVACLTRPVYAFDTVLGFLNYGEEVLVSTIEGAFARVHTAHLSGWIPTSSLSDDLKTVYANLKSAFVYGPFHQETVKVRRYINDEALGTKLELALQATEFILYTLKQARINVQWPSGRPRLPGGWQSLLRGVPGVTISVLPKTGSVLDSVGNSESAFLAYVQEVYPDQSLKISSVGLVEEGEYREEVFTKEQWKEWRPVFISFS